MAEKFGFVLSNQVVSSDLQRLNHIRTCCRAACFASAQIRGTDGTNRRQEQKRSDPVPLALPGTTTTPYPLESVPLL